MNTTTIRNQSINRMLYKFRIRRGLAFGIMIITALLAFEIFNYSTTDFALSDLLGDLRFVGIRWSTILAIAFCGIDFAGIARLFTPEEGADEPTEVWYLFGAWLLAATMNAMLTWWGVSIALLNHQSLGNQVIARETLLNAVPIFVAVLVWLIRVLIIGTFSVAGERLFSQADRYAQPKSKLSLPVRNLNKSKNRQRRSPISAASFKPSPKPQTEPEPTYRRGEPTYHPVGLGASESNNRSRSLR